MVWLSIGASLVVLLVVGVITRRLLGLGRSRPKSMALAGTRDRVTRTATLELEAQSAVLAVTLNEAMEDRDSGRPDLVLSTLRLAAAHWNRQAATLAALLEAVTRHLPLASMSLPSRALVGDFFKSEAMRGRLALHEGADQFVLRGKPRFSLHVRTLDQAVALLTADFLDAQSGLEPSPAFDLWKRLDHDFHDFDLLTKETVLVIRGFVLCLPAGALKSFASEVLPALHRGVRASADEPWDD